MILRNRRNGRIVCPMCGRRELVSGDDGWGSEQFRCRNCRCLFELDTGSFLESKEPIFFSPFLNIVERGRNDRFSRVVLWLDAIHPEWRPYLEDRGFVSFLHDLYAYNEWLNRGNCPTFEELADEGGFEEDVRSILGQGDSVDQYFDIQFDNTPDDEKEEITELYDRFQDLRKRYGQKIGNENRRKGRRNRRERK